MDQDRFDRLARLTRLRLSRRAGLGIALVTALGLAPEATAKRRCKRPRKRCGGKCVNVKTNRKNCGRCRRACGAGEKCKRGRCRPASNECVGQPDHTRCGDLGAGRCVSGVCIPRPTCGEQDTVIEDGDCSHCCSGECEPITTGPSAGRHLCTWAQAGQQCRVSRECFDGQACVGYRCGGKLVCPAEAPMVCDVWPSVEGCIPAACDPFCAAPCDPRSTEPCGECDPYLACVKDPYNPEDVHRCRPQLPPTVT
jgi:hypothetical protein